MKAIAFGAVAGLACFALAGTLSAQVPLTLKGGINLSNFVGGDAGTTEQAKGLNMGASFGLFRVKRVQLVAEVYYRQKGAIGSLDDLTTFSAEAGGETPVAQDLEVGLDYIEIPFLARVDLGKQEGRFFPYLFGGPAFGWRISCGVAVSGASSQPETQCDDLTQELEKTLRGYEIGIVFGGGVDYALPRGIGAINLDARYTGGLSTVGGGADALDVRNQAFTLMLGWSFGLPGLGAAGVQPGL